MNRKGWVGRIGIPVLLLALFSALLALVASDPWTFSNIGDGFLVGLTAPFQSAWWRVRSTGPVRRTILLVLFVILPVLLLPAYALRAKTSSWILTAVATVLWMMSGFLMLALRYVD